MKFLASSVLLLASVAAHAGDPAEPLRSNYPVLAKAVRSVGYECPKVIQGYASFAPGVVYYVVTCESDFGEWPQYTVGVSKKLHVVVWPGARE